MQVDHITAARLFVQVVDILGNDMYIKILFQFSQSGMSGIRPGVQQLPASLVIEVED